MIRITVNNFKETWSVLKLVISNTEYILKEYSVSTFGRVKYNNHYLEPKKDRKGYLKVCVKNPVTLKYQMFMIHRLVGFSFIPNPNNLPQINHKDLDKSHNFVDNLEWITNIENSIHQRFAHKTSVFTETELKIIASIMYSKPWSYDEILETLGYSRNDKNRRQCLLAMVSKRPIYTSIIDISKIKPRIALNNERIDIFNFTKDQIRLICKEMSNETYSVKSVKDVLGIDIKTSILSNLMYNIKNLINHQDISKDYKFGKFINAKVASTERIEKICELLISSKSIQEISRTTGSSRKFISKILNKKIYIDISSKYF